MIALMIISFILLLLLGMPVAFAMAISGTLALFGLSNVSWILVPQRMFLALNSFPFLAIPLFILAGELMNTGGITRRIVRFADSLLRQFRGGLAYVNVLTNIIMAGFSGSATADAVAIGSIMIPAMVDDGYPPGFSAGLTASASCIGPIIPPSITMVMYGAITGVSIGSMFLGGFIPGLLIGLGLMALVWFYARKYDFKRSERASLSEILSSLKDAIWALIAPVIILFGIMSGVITATEAGVIAVIYALVVGLFIYKEINIKQIPAILAKAGMSTAVPSIIISCSAIFGWILARENFAVAVIDIFMSISTNPHVVYFMIILMLFLIGLFVDGSVAIIVFSPILFPIGNQMGFDPIHFALVIIITILIGTVTPPVGLQLYIASSIAKLPISKVTIWPFVAVMVAVLFLITYVPSLVTYIPHLVFGV
ncbi:TRAP transporter large permease [Lutispora saccharofermentans]|uniref:TRAP transporter large permease n=1 Tax=Lutispora saccharofermentans TaxID=3024236 RepID=A0ABT1NJB9_9FIRM|nr:TRAP transporter large permease [Lutispora saccharofermentans]MCQ1530674.1 TRAP transporter large permease [Lutispora saccharofermentans]